MITFHLLQAADQHTSRISTVFTGLLSADSNLARSAGVDLKQCEAPGHHGRQRIMAGYKYRASYLAPENPHGKGTGGSDVMQLFFPFWPLHSSGTIK